MYLQREKLEQFKKKIHLKWFYKYLALLPFTPNVYTTLSLIFGLLSVYFLFTNQVLFLLFVLLHLFCDLCDGGLARYLHRTSCFGEWYDFGVDRVVQALLLFKFSFISWWGFIVFGLFVLHNVVYLFQRKDVYYSRTVTLVAFCLQLYLVGVMFTGVVTLYGLVKQLRHIL